VGERIKRCDALPPREAIEAFFRDILNRSLNDVDHKGCLLVNSALEIAPHDPEFQEVIASVLRRIEKFFLKWVKAGQADGTITCSVPAQNLAHHLLAVLMGVRVLARVRPERALLEGVVVPALALLDRN
jgi:TetR/AcrR family transcriptional repressor of nem operon